MIRASRPSTAILLQTHSFEGAVLRLHRALQHARAPNETVFVLMHVPPGTPKPATLSDVPSHFVTTTQIRTPDFVSKSAGDNWTVWSGGHTDLIALHFARDNPGFEHYWVIEYDVRFTGSWRVLFDHFADNAADLLATTIQSYDSNQNWHWWDSVTDPNGNPARKTELLRAFMPIFRFSRAAALEMERRYRQGWSGHTEVTWPSYLNDAGLKIEDLGSSGPFVNPQNRGRFYSNHPLECGLGPGTLVWRPARLMPGFRRNWLYHPIKPPKLAIQDKWNFWSTHIRWRLNRKRLTLRSAFVRLLRRATY